MSEYDILAQHGDFTANGDDNMVGDVIRGTYGGGNGFSSRAMVVGSTVRRTGNPGSNNMDEDEVLEPNGSLKKKPIKHNSVTYYLTKVPSATADRELKSRVYEDAVVTVRNGGEDDWGVKTSFLCMYFGYQMVEKQAQMKVNPFKTPTSAAFQWVFKGLLALDGTVPAPAGAPADIPINAAFVCFDVTMDPTPVLANVTVGQAVPQYSVGNVTVRVGNLPRAGNLAATHAMATLSPLMTNNGVEMLIGVWDATNSVSNMQTWEKHVKKFFHRCLFEVAVPQLRLVYVGTGVYQTAESRLQSLRQSRVKNGKSETLAVENFYAQFLNVVNELDSDQRYPNLTQIFVQGLVRSVREHMLSNFQFDIPTQVANSNYEETIRLTDTKNLAVRAEKAVMSTIRTAQLALGGNYSRQAGRSTFLATPNSTVPILMAPSNQVSFEEGNETTEAAALVAPGFSGFGSRPRSRAPNFATTVMRASPQQISYTSANGDTAETQYLAFATAPTSPQVEETLISVFLSDPSMPKDYADVYDHACRLNEQTKAFLSAAESAMANASGARATMQCYGCGKEGHLWRNCDQRNDPEVRRKASQMLRKRFGDRKPMGRPTRTLTATYDEEEYYTPDELVENFKDLGIRKVDAEFVRTLMSKSLPTEERSLFTIGRKGTRSTKRQKANPKGVLNLMTYPMGPPHNEADGIPPFEVENLTQEHESNGTNSTGEDIESTEDDEVEEYHRPRLDSDGNEIESEDDTEHHDDLVMQGDYENAIIMMMNSVMYVYATPLLLGNQQFQARIAGLLQNVLPASPGMTIQQVPQVSTTGDFCPEGQCFCPLARAMGMDTKPGETRDEFLVRADLENFRIQLAGMTQEQRDETPIDLGPVMGVARYGASLTSPAQALRMVYEVPPALAVQRMRYIGLSEQRIRREVEQREWDVDINNENESRNLIATPIDEERYAKYTKEGRVLQFLPPEQVLSITRNLPHVKLPIGRGETDFTLYTAVDSCAGCNLGDLEYHQRLSELYPESVAQFLSLESTGNAFSIGGIEKEGTGVRITHVITYWMPSSLDGQHAKVSFGLGKNVSATALVGVGFMKSSRAIITFSEHEPELFIQAIEVNLPITYAPPTLREPPTRKDASSAYLTATEESEEGSEEEESERMSLD